MPDPQPEASPTPTLTPEQQDTSRLLDRLFGKTIADRYADCCALASGSPGLHASIPLAAHAMREFKSILRTTLIGPMEAELLPTKAEAERLAEAAAFLSEKGFDADPIRRAIERLQSPRHADEIKAIADRLGFATDAEETKAWITLNRMAGGAHKRSFHEELEVDEAFREEFQRPFDFVVRAIATALQGKYSAFMLRANELAAMTDAGLALKQFEKEIPGAPNLQWHFFQTIDGARWLKPLLRSRFVLEPQLKLSDSGRSVRSRQWPIGAYLRRMAVLDDAAGRALVGEALRKVAGSQNPDVREQGIRIVAALPVADAAALTDVLIGWLDQQLQHGYLDTPVKLIATFAESSLNAEAFAIARAVFRLSDVEGTLVTLHAHAMYEHYVPQAVAALGKLDSKASVKLFSDLLMEAATISRRWGGEYDRTEHTPHPIADSQMATYDVYDSLVIAVRDSAYRVIEQAPADFQHVISDLFNRGPRILKRVALQALSRAPAKAPSLGVAYLADKDLIGASWCEDEYAELAKAWFPQLDPAQQASIFAVVDAMPDQYKWWPERFKEHHGRVPDADDMRRFRSSVIRDATWHWRDALPGPRRQALDEIVQDIDEPDHVRRDYFRESVSPMSGDDFAARPIDDIVKFLQNWRPQAEPVRQTVSALAHQLQTAVQQSPARFIDHAAQLSLLRPVYLRHILIGLDTPARSAKGITFNNALSLIESTIDRSNEAPDSANSIDGDDKNWHWAAFAAADLLKTLVRRNDDALVLTNDQLPRIVRIIELLANRAPRAPETNDFEDQFKKFPAFAAERTLRGSVSDLCMLFLYWAAQRNGAPLSAEPRAALAQLGPIQALLDAELDDQSSNGRIPRAVLGHWLRNVLYFGESWLRSRMARMFPSDDRELRDAAWSGHLLNNSGPLGPLMPDLLQSYEDEIARLPHGDTTDEKSNRANRLSEYLVILFVHDAASIELMNRFWAAASDRIRQQAMWFLGRHILAVKDMNPSVLDRGRTYWDIRLSAAKAANDKAPFEKELGAIGQWMISPGIDDDWLADQLQRLLRVGIAPNNGYFVIEWLGKRVFRDPDGVIATLVALLAIPDLEPSVYMTHGEHIRTILVQGREKGTPASMTLVNEAINRLASFGEPGYLDLLTPN